MRPAKTFALLLFVTVVLFTCSLPAAAQDPAHYPQAFGVSAPLRDLAALPDVVHFGLHEANPVRRIPKRNFGHVVDAVEQNFTVPAAGEFSIGADFLGVGNGFPNFSDSVAPPDTTMAVGDTQVVQWVNASYTVCQKTSPYTCGPAIAGNKLWAGLSGNPLCKTQNDGDIIAQWDVKAHRWLLTQNVFSAPYAVCIAISKTPDATGAYYLYQFGVPGGNFPDYPKWGVWPTDYGQAINSFSGNNYVGPMICLYNRAKMLRGDQSAEQICHQFGITPQYQDSLLPADQDSQTDPPAGQDHMFIGSLGDVDNSHLSLYTSHINKLSDWTQGATFTGDQNSQLISIATFNPACGDQNYGGACVPQKGVSDFLDSLGGRLMYRFAYWNDGPQTGPQPMAQHWYTNWDVAASEGGQNAVRWMEITGPVKRITNTNDLTVHQQGTYAPDGNWRWMGSVTQDRAGDILVGYSESCGNTCPGGTPMFPSIFLAGRTPSDALGTLGPEALVVAGAGSQPDTSNRWGDYSSMRIDPNDGCTFWYTTEFYKVTQNFDWSTQVASARFSNCK